MIGTVSNKEALRILTGLIEKREVGPNGKINYQHGGKTEVEINQTIQSMNGEPETIVEALDEVLWMLGRM